MTSRAKAEHATEPEPIAGSATEKSKCSSMSMPRIDRLAPERVARSHRVRLFPPDAF
jgi:hypothetical protein